MKFTLENTQQYNSKQLLELWCKLSGGPVPRCLADLAAVFLSAVAERNGAGAVEGWRRTMPSAYDLICVAQRTIGGDYGAPIDISCDSLGQLWILRYEITKRYMQPSLPRVSRPFISTGIHIHRTKEYTATVSALYVDFDDDDLMKMLLPPVTRTGVEAVDRYLKAANAKLISDDMDVIHKNMVPALGQMLGWLLAQPQVKPLLDLVAQEVVN